MWWADFILATVGNMIYICLGVLDPTEEITGKIFIGLCNVSDKTIKTAKEIQDCSKNQL